MILRLKFLLALVHRVFKYLPNLTFMSSRIDFNGTTLKVRHMFKYLALAGSLSCSPHTRTKKERQWFSVHHRIYSSGVRNVSAKFCLLLEMVIYLS